MIFIYIFLDYANIYEREGNELTYVIYGLSYHDSFIEKQQNKVS